MGKRERGFFVSFEGIDGSGKSTQILRLRDNLVREGFSVVLVREPGGTSLGERIRPILLDKSSVGMCMETELLLFEAARAQIVHEVISPALQDGKIVLCDRFFDATVAYQGYGRGLPIERIEWLNRFAAQTLEPDITFLLDIPEDVALARREGRGKEDRMEAEGRSFLKRVREGYLALPLSRKNIVVMDARLSEEELEREIKKKFVEVADI